jgi:hypothetical protein
VPHLRGSLGPSLMYWERCDVAVVALAVAKICSYAGSRRPMMGLVIAPETLAGKVEDEVGMTGRLEEEDQPGRLQTRDLGGLHLDLLSESLVLGLVVLSSGLVGECGRPGFAA